MTERNQHPLANWIRFENGAYIVVPDKIEEHQASFQDVANTLLGVQHHLQVRKSSNITYSLLQLSGRGVDWSNWQGERAATTPILEYAKEKARSLELCCYVSCGHAICSDGCPAAMFETFVTIDGVLVDAVTKIYPFYQYPVMVLNYHHLSAGISLLLAYKDMLGEVFGVTPTTQPRLYFHDPVAPLVAEREHCDLMCALLDLSCPSMSKTFDDVMVRGKIDMHVSGGPVNVERFRVLSNRLVDDDAERCTVILGNKHVSAGLGDTVKYIVAPLRYLRWRTFDKHSDEAGDMAPQVLKVVPSLESLLISADSAFAIHN